VDRLWFAGEATSTQHFGFLHGAWFEGQEAGERVSSLLKGNLFGSKSGPMEVYKNLHGTTEEDQYNESNGWYIDTVGDE
jgi:polyamine oxidase